ncbi:hypothetical protein EZV62_012518 [Acer yangbiense]|uniref:Protein kinase domain-containing protein n=1 Tax=Acer yangbiense TaxID=1000413 RepID=A0A5C7HWH8_9ROSI|nr:hypothetical protein EZV62_012518 [Acer yangbiense]
MKSKPKQAFLYRFMGICFSIEEDQQQQHQSTTKPSNNEVGNGSTSYASKCDRQVSSSVGIRSNSVNLTPKDVNELRQSPGYSNVDIFTYVEMTLATKYFRPDYILGEGGFGVVYKGVLDESVRSGYQTTNVAIKELNRGGFQGVGCTLTWSKRIKIALDAAKGLAFLHGAERPVIYRDFKTSNILLDADFNAKLSDFGLAKDGPMGDQTHVSTRVMGTYGYAAPEYVMTGHLTARSDVYGFGVVLLEMLLGRRAVDKGRPSREHNLVEWARPLLNHNKKLLRILDPRLEGQYSVRTAMKVANLAYQCLSQNPKGRPLMSQVVELLETITIEVGSHEEAILQSGDSAVTLYEAPKPGEKKRNQTACDGNREDAAQRRSKPGNGRSKSEPPENIFSAGSSPTNIIEDDEISVSARH